MYTLECDRPPFVRVYGREHARLAEKVFACPVLCRGEGDIAPVTPAPCQVYVAGPFEDFASVAARTGREEAKLAEFNGGVVYPSRAIYLY